MSATHPFALALPEGDASFEEHLKAEHARYLNIIHERAAEFQNAVRARGPVGVLLGLLHCGVFLQRQKRDGFNDRDNKVPQVESVSEHTFSMDMAAWWLAEKYGIDPFRLSMLIKVHDLTELLMTDIVVYNYHTSLRPQVKAMKQELERYATTVLVNTLDELDPAERVGQRLLPYLVEYEEQKTQAARLTKLLDRIDVVVKAVHFDRQPGQQVDVAFFIGNVREILNSEPLFQEALEHLEQNHRGT